MEAQSRRLRAIALYQEGFTQAEVGRQVGVSRQRVQQYLNDAGVPIRTSAEQREADYQVAVHGRAEEIEASFWQARDFREVGRRLGLKERYVKRFMEDRWPDVSVFKDTKWGGQHRFTDAEMLEALRAAAAAPGMSSPMSHDEYNAWAADASDRRPAAFTIMVRFDTWRAALSKAGLPANETRRGRGDFTIDVCTEALARAWIAAGKAPSIADYGVWHRQNPGSPGPDIVRVRFNHRWTDAKIAAYPRVHGKLPPLGWERPLDSEPMAAPRRLTSVGRAYRPRDVSEWHRGDQVFALDPAVVERGVQEHFELEKSLADTVRAAGHVPLSPTGSDPPFDLAWRQDDVLHVVEVKSATPMNVEGQARLGIGQVLRYCEELRERGERVQAVLAIELPPDPVWTRVATRIDVRLVHPGAPITDVIVSRAAPDSE